MNDLLMMLSLVSSGWALGLVTAFWWEDRDERRRDAARTTRCGRCAACQPPFDIANPRFSFMILCPECGNKRCPKATDHRHDCTGSNEPGQLGSRFQNPPPPSGDVQSQEDQR